MAAQVKSSSKVKRHEAKLIQMQVAIRQKIFFSTFDVLDMYILL